MRPVRPHSSPCTPDNGMQLITCAVLLPRRRPEAPLRARRPERCTRISPRPAALLPGGPGPAGERPQEQASRVAVQAEGDPRRLGPRTPGGRPGERPADAAGAAAAASAAGRRASLVDASGDGTVLHLGAMRGGVGCGGRMRASGEAVSGEWSWQVGWWF